MLWSLDLGSDSSRTCESQLCSKLDVCIRASYQTLNWDLVQINIAQSRASFYSQRRQHRSWRPKRHGFIAFRSSRRTSVTFLLLGSSKSLSSDSPLIYWTLNPKLFRLFLQQTRGDSISSCSPNDGFVSKELEDFPYVGHSVLSWPGSVCTQGKYCPTTCGVADYLLRYMPGVTRELDALQRELETISNLTQGAEETVVNMKDSVTSHQKSSLQGNIKCFFNESFCVWFSYLPFR